MIQLYLPNIQFNGVNASPFCQKLISFLDWHNLEYQIEFALPNHGPKQKVPFAKIDGQLYADSEIIIAKIAELHQLDVQLTATAQAWQRLLEEHLYWAMVYCRWLNESSWQQLKAEFFAPVPKLMRNIIANKARKLAKQNLYSQGLGRFNQAELMQRAENDLTALNDYLAEHEFLGGEQPNQVDFFASSLLQNITAEEVSIAIAPYAQQKHLQQYCQRVALALRSNKRLKAA